MKTAFIMRGLPGSGKSTIARSIGWTEGAEIFSTDDFFVGSDGVYRFRRDELHIAHGENKRRFADACDRSVPAVICDNTNTQRWEYEDYVHIAELHGYAVVFVELPHPRVSQCVERNTHGVPREAIERMLARWETR